MATKNVFDGERRTVTTKPGPGESGGGRFRREGRVGRTDVVNRVIRIAGFDPGALPETGLVAE